jgi:hypothetical protein
LKCIPIASAPQARARRTRVDLRQPGGQERLGIVETYEQACWRVGLQVLYLPHDVVEERRDDDPISVEVLGDRGHDAVYVAVLLEFDVEADSVLGQVEDLVEQWRLVALRGCELLPSERVDFSVVEQMSWSSRVRRTSNSIMSAPTSIAP